MELESLVTVELVLDHNHRLHGRVRHELTHAYLELELHRIYILRVVHYRGQHPDPFNLVFNL